MTGLSRQGSQATKATKKLYEEKRKHDQSLSEMKQRLSSLSDHLGKLSGHLEPSWLPEKLLNEARTRQAHEEDSKERKLDEVDSYIIKVMEKLDSAISRSKLQTENTKEVLNLVALHIGTHAAITAGSTGRASCSRIGASHDLFQDCYVRSLQEFP